MSSISPGLKDKIENKMTVNKRKYGGRLQG